MYCWWEYVIIQPLWNAIWQYLLKALQKFIPFSPVTPLLKIYLFKRCGQTFGLNLSSWKWFVTISFVKPLGENLLNDKQQIIQNMSYHLMEYYVALKMVSLILLVV